MEFRFLSAAVLALGGLLSALIYFLLPMAGAVACVEQPADCPGTSQLLLHSALPLVVAIALVAVAALAHRRYPRLARIVLAVPVAIAVLWVGGLLLFSLT